MLKDELNENGTVQENLYRHVPSLNNLLLGPNFQGLLGTHERSVVVQATREELIALKRQIASGQLSQHNLSTYLDLLPDRVLERWWLQRSFYTSCQRDRLCPVCSLRRASTDRTRSAQPRYSGSQLW